MTVTDRPPSDKAIEYFKAHLGDAKGFDAVADLMQEAIRRHGYAPAESSGFTMVPDALLRFKVSPSAKVVAIALLQRARRMRICWPSQKGLGAVLNLSERQVRRCLTELLDAGLAKPAGRMGFNGTDIYDVSALQALTSTKSGVDRTDMSS